MMHRCDTCKFWQRDCRNTPCASHGFCLLTVDYAHIEHDSGAKFGAACTCDGRNENLWVWTDEDFGCIHWKPEPEPKGIGDDEGDV